MRAVEEKDPLDTTIIEALIAEIGPESMARVLDAMAGDAERLLVGLEKAMISGDGKAFSLFAHSLKSNALTVGAVAVGELFQELETMGIGTVVPNTETLVRQAQADYRRLIGFIVTVPESDPEDPEIKMSSIG
jgi:HPt (histidine-containing phosphotransfer) domain-containing protein